MYQQVKKRPVTIIEKETLRIGGPSGEHNADAGQLDRASGDPTDEDRSSS
jgi:hypothetical protein